MSKVPRLTVNDLSRIDEIFQGCMSAGLAYKPSGELFYMAFISGSDIEFVLKAAEESRLRGRIAGPLKRAFTNASLNPDREGKFTTLSERQMDALTDALYYLLPPNYYARDPELDCAFDTTKRMRHHFIGEPVLEN